MPTKMGRPKSENPKDTKLTIRLDAETVRKLDENAAHYRETRTKALRRGIEEVNRSIKKE